MAGLVLIMRGGLPDILIRCYCCEADRCCSPALFSVGALSVASFTVPLPVTSATFGGCTTLVLSLS